MKRGLEESVVVILGVRRIVVSWQAGGGTFS